MKRLKVLVSAYACEPGKGSEPGVGWTLAVEMARYHDIWVITRASNRPAIAAALAGNPIPGLHFVFWDLPQWARFWKRGRRGVHLYYYLWQLRILGIARSLHRRVEFDLVHHVTFVRYWAPSFLCFLNVPLVWGPVGGGESAPRSFWAGAGLRATLYETLREAARWIGDHGPFVRATAKRAAVILTTTDRCAARIRALGGTNVLTMSEVALPREECMPPEIERKPRNHGIRFVGVGQLIHIKGFDIALRAFARARIPESEYWLIGDGREGPRLRALARKLGIADRVRFWGVIPRQQVLTLLCDCDVMLHPALHDSGGWAAVEAMAAGLPVVCLDLGGPATQVTPDCGFKIPAGDPDQASREICCKMIELARDRALRRRLSRGALERVQNEFSWSSKAAQFNRIYEMVTCQDRPTPTPATAVSWITTRAT